jgi:hypothetical protein
MLGSLVVAQMDEVAYEGMDGPATHAWRTGALKALGRWMSARALEVCGL